MKKMYIQPQVELTRMTVTSALLGVSKVQNLNQNYSNEQL